jgi:hypothetical protein
LFQIHFDTLSDRQS